MVYEGVLKTLRKFGGGVGSPAALLMVGMGRIRSRARLCSMGVWIYINDDGDTGNAYHPFVMRREARTCSTLASLLT